MPTKCQKTGVCRKPYRKLRLAKGVALVDAEDYERVAALSWHQNSRGYIRCIQKDPKTGELISFSLHRFVLNYWGKDPIDHINHKPWDNRKHNLRVCTNSVNGHNRKGLSLLNTSGYTGVVRAFQDKGWLAYKTYDRKRYNLGTFETALSAARFRNKWQPGMPLHRPKLRRNNHSGYAGVNFRRDHWEARLFRDAQFYGLGCFPSREEAVQARRFAEDAFAKGWVVRPTSCHCKGRHAWFEVKDGCEISRGCLCCATQRIVSPAEGKVGLDWGMS